MEIVLVILAALVGSSLSFFSGFGLGTILLPAFMVFFPPPVAIAATAVVHMLNNVFKLFLVGKYAHWGTVKSFGLLSVFGAVGGALLMGWVTGLPLLASYSIGSAHFEMSWIKTLMAVLIIGFACIEIMPRFRVISLPQRWLPAGGLLSGFFGGLSGHQGALRSAFLMKSGLSKEAFLGTRVVCACLVDTSRISIYAAEIGGGWKGIDWNLAAAATLAAFAGAWLGNRWMKKTTMVSVERFVTWSLIIFGLALGAGAI